MGVKERVSPPSKGTAFLMTGIIMLVSFGVSFNSLFNGFVYDDTIQVLQNNWLLSSKYIPDIFSSDAWRFQRGPGSNYYRPLMHVIYMLAYHIFGLKPWGFHLVNVLLHSANSVLVFLLASRFLRGFSSAHEGGRDVPLLPGGFLGPPFIAAILFAVHPVHTEAVAWVASLPEVSFAFFSLLSLYFFVRSANEASLFKKDYLLSLLFFFFAALCKETALVLPVLLLFLDHLFKNERGGVFRRGKRYVPYFMISGVYFIMRLHALGAFAPVVRHRELSLYHYLINVFPLFMTYIEKLFLPTDLNAFYVFHPITSIFAMRGILAFFFTLAFVILTLTAMRKNKTVFFSLLFMAVPLLPVLYIPALGENTFAERYLYFPSVGFVLLLALVLSKARIHNPKLSNILTAIYCVMIVVYSAGTISRNTVWSDEYTLWADTVKKSPDSAVVQGELGNALLSMGRTDEAIEHHGLAAALAPNDWLILNNFGFALATKGLWDDAITQYRTALLLGPLAEDRIYVNMGFALDKKGLTEEATENYETALRLNPSNVKARFSLGLAYARSGRLDKAVGEFQAALQLRPDYAEVHSSLGTTYGMLGLRDKAVEHLRAAVSLRPDFADAHYNLGIAYIKNGSVDKAIEHMQAAVRLDPANTTFRKGLTDMMKYGPSSSQ